MPSANFTANCQGLVGHTIDDGRFQFVSVLGVGAYGVVYLAQDCCYPSNFYAVKCLNNVGLDARQRHFQRREINLHKLASAHTGIVTLHKVIEEKNIVYVILDYCPDGDLFGMITERQRYLSHDELIRKVFVQIIDAVQHCHSMGIYHRDLKPENILCLNDGEKLVMADFGLATTEKMSTDFGCGSTFYMSPECQGGIYERVTSYSTLHNDIWSLGVILVNLTCGRNPWRQACQSDETFNAYLHNPNFLQTILPVSNQTNSILKRIFHLNPTSRISLKDLRKMVLEVNTFTMSEDELAHAHAAARAAAARPITPSPQSKPRKVVPAPRAQPQQVDFSLSGDEIDIEPVSYSGPRSPASPSSSSSHSTQFSEHQSTLAKFPLPTKQDQFMLSPSPSQSPRGQEARLDDASALLSPMIEDAMSLASPPHTPPRRIIHPHNANTSGSSGGTTCNDNSSGSSASSSSSYGKASLPPTPEMTPYDKKRSSTDALGEDDGMEDVPRLAQIPPYNTRSNKRPAIAPLSFSTVQKMNALQFIANNEQPPSYRS